MYLSARDMARLGLLMLRPRQLERRAARAGPTGVDETTTLVTPQKRDQTRLLRGPDVRELLGLRHAVVGVGRARTSAAHVTGPYQGAYSAMGAYGQYITVLPVLDLVVAHQVAFEDADERAGREIADVKPWEYDALLANDHRGHHGLTQRDARQN